MTGKLWNDDRKYPVNLRASWFRPLEQLEEECWAEIVAECEREQFSMHKRRE